MKNKKGLNFDSRWYLPISILDGVLTIFTKQSLMIHHHHLSRRTQKHRGKIMKQNTAMVLLALAFGKIDKENKGL